MKDSQFIHTYKHNRGQKRPVITTAIKLDRTDNGKLLGVAIGFSYCSRADHPNKKVGRMIAMDRANKEVERIASVINVGGKPFLTGDVSRYRNKRKKFNENNEPRFMGHPLSIYIPFPLRTKEQLELVRLPDEPSVYSRLLLALSNVEKFGQL